MLSIFFPKQVQFFEDIVCYKHYMKSVRIRSFSGPYFPEFGLNTKRYSLSLRIHSECGKIRTRKTANMDTFHAVEGNGGCRSGLVF